MVMIAFVPERQIRAYQETETVRVYQAYNHQIADAALAAGRFVSPSFEMRRMTWIKPSFLWMMYRAGWGAKDDGQARILAIDLRRDGFEWALSHGCLSHMEFSDSTEARRRTKEAFPVRIQWDPERDLDLKPLRHRTIQIGLSGEAVELYTRDWIAHITDVTTLAHRIKAHLDADRRVEAQALLPVESVYVPRVAVPGIEDPPDPR